MAGSIIRRFVISDRHHNHHMLVEKGYRPENYEELLISNWQKLVRPQDIVYDLGDIILYHREELAAINAKLPGIKIAVLGNHDRGSDSFYIEAGYNAVSRGVVIGKNILTHKPIELPTSQDYLKYNIHGHLHSRSMAELDKVSKSHMCCYDGRHILYSAEKQNYKPILIEQLVARHENKLRNITNLKHDLEEDNKNGTIGTNI